MMIGSGILKGLKLAAPPGLTTRPTRALARGAFVNSIQQLVMDSKLLDIFAGTGAVGLESISRGAKSCVFVEQDPKASHCIEKNLAEAERRFIKQNLTPPELVLVAMDILAAWNRLKKLGPFDVIWADPPYDIIPDISSVLAQETSKICTPEAYFFLESGDNCSIEELGPIFSRSGWIHEKTKSYGISQIHKFKRV
jgi:16S rRNA (guanine966-N2)-methyltransferase